jgi:hypothetical protein
MTSLLFHVVQSNGQTEEVTVPLDDAELLAGVLAVDDSVRLSGSSVARRLYEAIADNTPGMVIEGDDRAFIYAALIWIGEIRGLSQPSIDLRVVTTN